MSSKRGRKRNDNLPPNRARDVQRAFRARRAAHLQALEQRIAELEEENNCLRQALNLPPSDRPPLGRGPTGKDKPKNYGNTSQVSSSIQPLPSASPTRKQSTIIDSPGSRTSSLSPHTINVSLSSMSTRPMQIIDSSSSWSGDLLSGDGYQSNVPGPTNSLNQFTPMTASLPLKPPYPSHTSSSLPSSSSRNSMSSDVYVSNNPLHYSSDRPLSQSYSGQSFAFRDAEACEDPPRHYSYTPSPFQTYGHTNMHAPSSSHEVSTHSQPQPQPPQHHRESPLSYALVSHRRNVTDPHSFSISQRFPGPPHLSQVRTHQQSVIHHPELMRSLDNMEYLTPPQDQPYGPDGRLNHHPLP